MITADKIAAGSITTEKLCLYGESNVKSAVKMQKQTAKQCQCCGSRFFTNSICDYCRSPQ